MIFVHIIVAYNRLRREALHMKLSIINIHTKCSSLNYHIFSLKIISYTVMRVRTNGKYFPLFFECPNFNTHRQMLLQSLNNFNITLYILLLGNDTDNATIFRYVQIYISETKLFVLSNCEILFPSF
jgi:hypothetical protein